MSKRTVQLVILFGLFFLFAYSISLPQRILATANQIIFSTVRIPVCGDLVAEYPEACDNADLHDATCRTLGFDAGTVSCDIACDFDTTSCYGVAPTPLPTTTPTATPTASPISQSATPTSSTLTSEATPIPTFLPTQLLQFTPEILLKNLISYPLLPPVLFALDPDKNGIIYRDEVPVISISWVREWQRHLYLYETKQELVSNDCDFNSDEWCNIYDFSILLSYVNAK